MKCRVGWVNTYSKTAYSKQTKSTHSIGGGGGWKQTRESISENRSIVLAQDVNRHRFIEFYINRFLSINSTIKNIIILMKQAFINELILLNPFTIAPQMVIPNVVRMF